MGKGTCRYYVSCIVCDGLEMLTLVAKLAVALQEPLAYLSLCGYKRGSEIDSKYEARI